MKSKSASPVKAPGAAMPLYIFTAVFVLVPILYAVFLSFMTRTNSWAVDYTFTLANYAELLKPRYREYFGQSLRLALSVTGITVLVGYPAGLILGGLEEKKQKLFLSLITFPFWINSVVRISGIIVLLRQGGLFGFMRLLYTYPAVVLTMVYALLPFMIYSVYSVAVRLDAASLEASRVLGAGKTRAFLDITLPLTVKGLLTGVTLTFIPSMGLIYISNLLGGGKTVLIGNLIEDNLMRVHNLPLAAAMSVILMVLTGAVILLAGLLDPVARRRRRSLRAEKGGTA